MVGGEIKRAELRHLESRANGNATLLIRLDHLFCLFSPPHQPARASVLPADYTCFAFHHGEGMFFLQVSERETFALNHSKLESLRIVRVKKKELDGTVGCAIKHANSIKLCPQIKHR